MLGEFSEEYLQEVLDPVFRHITLKTEEEMNLLSPDALYAGFLGALFGSGVESVDAVVNGLSAESTAMDSSTKDSDYAEFADILNEPEDLENFKYLASLPKAEQEAFIASLTVDALEEGKPATVLEDSNYAEFAGIFEDLEGLDYLESLNGEELENFISSLTADALEEGKPPAAFEESDYAEFAGIFEDLEGLDCITLVRTSMFFFIDSSIKKKCGSGFCPLPHGVNLLISFSFCAEPQLQPVRPR